MKMHRPTITFSFSQNHNHSTKNNQPEQSIKSNNQKKQSPQPLNQKHSKNKPSKQTRQTISSINRKINHKNNHNKQSKISQSKTRSKQTQQAITKKCNVFEYYNIANSNGFRANRKYAFHKNSTQIHKTKQHNLYFEVTILQTRKSKTLYFLIIGNSQENIFNLE